MKLDDFVAVSAMPGLYKMIANRSNGLIVEDLDSGKRKFASSRKHQFTPLASIGIYTNDGDTAELKDVFQNMLDQYDDNPPVSANGDAKDVQAYFKSVLPDYDQDRVYMNDIKKVIKWFGFLKAHDLLNIPEDEKEEDQPEKATAAQTSEEE